MPEERETGDDARNREEDGSAEEPQSIGDIAREDQDIEEFDYSDAEEEQENTIQDAIKKIEKLEGRFESVDERVEAMNTRVSDMSERIGEVRSMVLEREREIDEMKSSVDRVEDIFEEISPEQFTRKLEKLDSRITEQQGHVEKNADMLSNLRKQLDDVKDTIGNVGSFENVADMYEQVEKKVSDIDEKKRYVDRVASKTESIFGELKQRLPEIDTAIDRTEVHEDMLKDQMKDIDQLSMQVEDAITEDELDDKLLEAMDKDRMQRRMADLTPIHDLQERVSELHEWVEEIAEVEERMYREFTEDEDELADSLSEYLDRVQNDINDLQNAVDDLYNRQQDIQDMTGVLSNYQRSTDRPASRPEPNGPGQQQTGSPDATMEDPQPVEEQGSTSTLKSLYRKLLG